MEQPTWEWLMGRLVAFGKGNLSQNSVAGVGKDIRRYLKGKKVPQTQRVILEAALTQIDTLSDGHSDSG